MRLPKVPGAGVANADGFKFRLERNNGTPGTRSGRRTFLLFPPPTVLMTAFVQTPALMFREVLPGHAAFVTALLKTCPSKPDPGKPTKTTSGRVICTGT